VSNILFIGPQGSGKGTQAKRVAVTEGIPHISTGDMFRAAIAAQTPLGREVQPFLDSGGLVPDELTIGLIKERLEQPDTEKGFVLDGFPRTMAQAHALDAMLAAIGRPLDVVFEFALSDELALERCLGRAAQEGRADDTPEVIAKRLATYHDPTEPIVGHYRAAGSLVVIQAERSVDDVTAELAQALSRIAS
jgi:adenylate kinase